MDIHKALLTEENPTGKLKTNGLELVGMVLGCMLMEVVWYNLVFKHVGLF